MSEQCRPEYRFPVDNDFLSDFETMSSHGATDGGGVERQAGSPADRLNRSWFASVAQSFGAKVHFDEIGNQFALFNFVPGAPYVGLGSHLDSQPLAGRFDGAYGVLAAAHAAARVGTAISQGVVKPAFNIAVINWFNEEGSRFSPSMMGSSVFGGDLDLEQALAATDLNGITVKETLKKAHWLPLGPKPDLVSYAEIHVEQGRLLEQTGSQIGLVTATWGATKFQAQVKGEQGHTGSTLMADRRDALFGASIIITALQRLTKEFETGVLQASVSQLTVEPNSPVTIAREVNFNVDLRSPDSDVLKTARTRLQKIITEAEAEARVVVDLKLTHEWALNPYPSDGVALARESADALNLSHQEIYTVAGHDSTVMKEHIPTIMLFIPSIAGISHNEKENTSNEDCLAGLKLFTELARRMVEGALAL